MNPKLPEAVEIFKELGWQNATSENILDLPLGTKEQQKISLDGLKSGEWTKPGSWNDFIFDVSPFYLAIFAIRVGVDMRRCLAVCDYWTWTKNDLKPPTSRAKAEVIATRGPKYAENFIKIACVSSQRILTHSMTRFGAVLVYLVDILSLEVPQNVEYIKDWAICAANSMNIKVEIHFASKSELPNSDFMRKRFIEHLEVGVALNTPATGPFYDIFLEGMKRSWISREKALALTFSALDVAVRPADRKMWILMLEELTISEQEVLEHSQSFIPLLALGESIIIEKIAPILLSQVEETLFWEVFSACCSAKTKKTKEIVLSSVLLRSCPTNTDEIVPWIQDFQKDKNKSVVTLAQKIIDQWDISLEETRNEELQIQELWQETPKVWSVPKFTSISPTPENLTDLIAKLVSQPTIIEDVTWEEFLAVANKVAYNNAQEARSSMRGLTKKRFEGMYFATCWVKQEVPVYGEDTEKRVARLLDAREYAVCKNLDILPCILSTPSYLDLSIDFQDLIDRAKIYQHKKMPVQESDLLLALTRLNVKTVPENVLEVDLNLEVPVLMQSGEKMSISVEQAIKNYIEEPLKEPEFKFEDHGFSDSFIENTAKSFPYFPNRFDKYTYERWSIFPNWGDMTLMAIAWDSDQTNHGLGLLMRQIACRSLPLTPGATMNSLAVLRSSALDAAEDIEKAYGELWERGLLRPHVADAFLLDWRQNTPSNLAALANALEIAAYQGTLSVVWPILDGLVVSLSKKSSHITVGVAEIINLIIIFLPEVTYAVEKGIAAKSELDLPGVRALAKKNSSSQAVHLAKQVVIQLPANTTVYQPEEIALDPPFEDLWTQSYQGKPAPEDNVSISIDFEDSDEKEKVFLFRLNIPSIENKTFMIVKKSWWYDLESEGQCKAYRVSNTADSATRNFQDGVWLHWEQEKNQMTVSEDRDQSNKKEGPSSIKYNPSKSLWVVAISLFAQSGASFYYISRMIREHVEKGTYSVDIAKQSMQIILQNPVVSPVKLVNIFEQERTLLPLLWPIFTECVKKAGEIIEKENIVPAWTSRVLSAIDLHAPYLVKAAKCGYIPKEDATWTGLKTIANAKSKSVAVAKAQKMLKSLELEM